PGCRRGTTTAATGLSCRRWVWARPRGCLPASIQLRSLTGFLAGRNMNVVPIDGALTRSARQVNADGAFAACAEGALQLLPCRITGDAWRRHHRVVGGIVDLQLGRRRAGARHPRRKRIGCAGLEAIDVLVDRTGAGRCKTE